MTDEPIKWHSDATAGDLPAMADLREHIKERDRKIEQLRAEVERLRDPTSDPSWIMDNFKEAVADDE